MLSVQMSKIFLNQNGLHINLWSTSWSFLFVTESIDHPHECLQWWKFSWIPRVKLLRESLHFRKSFSCLISQDIHFLSSLTKIFYIQFQVSRSTYSLCKILFKHFSRHYIAIMYTNSDLHPTLASIWDVFF